MILPVSVVDLTAARLKANEGFRPNVYKDTTGHDSIGYGFNISAGISQKAAAALLQAQTDDLFAQLAQFWWWDQLDPERASVVLEMAYNQGLHGLLGYVNMLAAIGKQDWATASLELLDSDAARQVPDRYHRLANILRTGDA